MARLQVRFSAAELMLILTTMKISSFPPMQQSSLITLTEEENKGALIAARDSLIARGLARMSEEDNLELHPLVLAAVGVAVRPEAGFWLSITEADSEPVNVYFSWTRRIAISNWMTRDEVFYFEQIKDRTLIAAEILKHSRVDQTETGEEGRSYTVQAALLNRIVNEQDIDMKEHLAELRKAGVPEEDADDFWQTIVHPTQRSILVAVSNMRAQPKTTTPTIWIKERHRWLITEHKEHSNLAVLRMAYGADIFDAVSDLVTTVIDSTLEQNSLIE
jgi:hypothetical protein